MTKKEYNAIRAATYAAAMEIPEVRDAVEADGGAYVVELHQLPDMRKFIVLTVKSQLNESTIRGNGFEPEKTAARILFSLNQQTKCATFYASAVAEGQRV